MSPQLLRSHAGKAAVLPSNSACKDVLFSLGSQVQFNTAQLTLRVPPQNKRRQAQKDKRNELY